MEASHQVNGSIGSTLDKPGQKPSLETLAPAKGKPKGEKEGHRPEGKAAESKPVLAEDRRKVAPSIDQQDFRTGKRERPGKHFQPFKGSETASRELAGRKGPAADKPTVVRQGQV